MIPVRNMDRRRQRAVFARIGEKMQLIERVGGRGEPARPGFEKNEKGDYVPTGRLGAMHHEANEPESFLGALTRLGKKRMRVSVDNYFDEKSADVRKAGARSPISVESTLESIADIGARQLFVRARRAISRMERPTAEKMDQVISALLEPMHRQIDKITIDRKARLFLRKALQKALGRKMAEVDQAYRQAAIRDGRLGADD